MAGRAALLAASAATAATAWVLVADQTSDTHQVLQTASRTARVLGWATGSLWQYQSLWAQKLPDARHTIALSELHTQRAHELRQVCQRNGGVYVKAAQFASNLVTVPREYRDVLGLLSDNCDGVPWEVARTIIEKEMRQELHQVFASIEETPVAAASLAQVHRGTLRSGEVVAVKVQYPGIALSVAADLNILSAAASFCATCAPSAPLRDAAASFRSLVSDLKVRLRHEVDFRREIQNSRRLATLLMQRDVTVPFAIERLSTRRLFVMEWIEGIRITDTQQLAAAGLDVTHIGKSFLRAFGEMLYVHGFVHGDLHRGNMLVRIREGTSPGDADRHEIVLLDHGWYLDIPDELRKQYCRLWCAFVLHDIGTAEAIAAELGGPVGKELIPAILNPSAIAADAAAKGRAAAAAQTQQQQEAARAKAREDSLSSLGGLAYLTALSQFPPVLVEVLRATAAVRSIAGELGMFAADRLKINAAYALKGLSIEVAQDGTVKYWSHSHQTWQEWRLSWKLTARINLLRALLWCQSVKRYISTYWHQATPQLSEVKP